MIVDRYKDIVVESYTGYWEWLVTQVTQPAWNNYFYWLTGISLLFIFLEKLAPWRKKQPVVRQDFWLDIFYMYFNYFLFSLLIFAAGSNVFVNLFNDFLGLFGVSNLVAINLQSLPAWAQMVILLVIADFLQWSIHVLLHRVPFLWEYHKVHHSVKEMGFAAHLRYHWMENVVYKSLQYVPLAMLGFSVADFFIVYMFNTVIGHWNHGNFTLPIGPLKYILNNPEMHIWHHAKELPPEHPYGVNFGITLSIWDYIFGTNYIPHNGRDIELGFPGDEDFPKGFVGQNVHGFFKKRKHKSSQSE